jgi:hypothetical protein
MHDYHPTILSADEYDRLQAMMCTMIGARTPLASLLRLKLGSAKVMPITEIGPDVVTSGRRVRFKDGRYKLDERTLLWSPVSGDDDWLLLSTTRGLSLLGLQTGQSISYLTDRRRTEFIRVEYVFPEDDEAADTVARTHVRVTETLKPTATSLQA